MSKHFYAGSCKNARVYLPQKLPLEYDAWPGGADAVLRTGTERATCGVDMALPPAAATLLQPTSVC